MVWDKPYSGAQILEVVDWAKGPKDAEKVGLPLSPGWSSKVFCLLLKVAVLLSVCVYEWEGRMFLLSYTYVRVWMFPEACVCVCVCMKLPCAFCICSYIPERITYCSLDLQAVSLSQDFLPFLLQTSIYVKFIYCLSNADCFPRLFTILVCI